ncbi:helix-turn-helix transcriptional regulator [Mycetocola zhadangensis]|uniref:WYL domain-containing protein n=1 Tax=Mycetocola zhadangensis TaxID=1164595 RepID=A0A3L7ISY7_9MICO|nr:WYL domain-containing protein [Mycetocola zhadangensis]RLQ81358.1 WYL domain-containing protein [Mycetocola zhadangensis]GGF02444.1 DeoR family transcriptional regulator [Mycetocola zhadangensis]
MSETTSRTLELLALLQTHRHWPSRELASRLDVTARTLRRDVDRLRSLGYRVTATRGSIGGYQLEAGSELPPLLLDDEEAVAMAIGLRAYATEGIAGGEVTALTALAKLEHLLPSELRRQVNALSAHVQPMRRDSPQVSAELLGHLALVCRDRDRIRFHYESRDGTASERLVEPHSIVSSSRHWFLVAWDVTRADWRTFRIDRISRYFNTRVRFSPRELPAEDAAEFITVAVSQLAAVRQHADVILDQPLTAMRAWFGPWAAGAEAVDETHTRWPIGGESFEALIASLAWIEPGVNYRIEGNPGFVDYLEETSRRMLRAASGGSERSDPPGVGRGSGADDITKR